MKKELTPDHIEVLQEVFNIAIGQAGSALAQIFDTFVKLSVPMISLLEKDQLNTVIPTVIGNLAEVSIARQSFYNHLNGEAFVIYSQEGVTDLSNLMSHSYPKSERTDSELLLDVTNILIGACLTSIAEQLETELSFSPPSIYKEKTVLENLYSSKTVPWNSTLLFRVTFQLENNAFSCHILFMMPDESIEELTGALDKWLEVL